MGPPFKRCMKKDQYDRQFPKLKKRATNGESVKGHVHNLWPYSTIKAAILVMNGAESGKLSDPITFQTKEGGKYLCIIPYQIGK